MDGTQTFTFNLTTDGQTQTRAGAPAVTGYKLQYFLQVLDASGTTIALSSQNNETGTFDVELPVGVTYTCLFWAHYITDAGAANEFFSVTDLKAVALKKHLTGDDQCQAFCATASVAADATAGSHTVMLKRAVAQVNIKSNTQMEGYSKLTAKYTDVPNTFNVQDNTVGSAGSVTTPSSFDVTDFTAVAEGGKFTYQSAYFLASSDGVGSMLGIEINTYNSSAPTTPIQTMTIANVPTKKNFKTNVVTDFNPANVAHAYTLSFDEWGTDVTVTPPSIWDGAAKTGNSTGSAFSGGTGADAENAYLISSASDLAQLVADVNAGCAYENKYFKLTVDVDLNNHEWTTIGTYNYTVNGKAFKGTFAGEHHKVTRLNVNSSAEKVSTGLFGYVNNGKIQNIHVSGTVNNTHATGSNCAGGIVGYLSMGEIKACSFDGSVNNSSSNGEAAGICGTTSSMVDIYGCINRGAITSGKNAGGITNYCQGSIMACYNEGTITAAAARGIAIMSGDASDFVAACYNIGTVTGTTLGPIGDKGVTECYANNLYSTTEDVKEFGASVWPDAFSNDDNLWYVDAAPDGTYKRDSSTGWKYKDCKLWKSIGGWNGGGAAIVYPKLWWEE